ncbi:pseudouridine synthase [Cyathus striatus]|nr:pseudouridine synthase [Cyathus striatus]
MSAIRGLPWRNPVLYADKGLIVVNKSPGLICQIDRTSEKVPEFNRLLAELRDTFAMEHMPFPVHRLDKGTTGALIFGRTDRSAREVSQQFQQGTIHKSYLALVFGGTNSFDASCGKIRSPIQYVDGRAELHPMGKESATDWELLASSAVAPVSLLRLNLLTGNKHQLRIHLSRCLRAPIIGDRLYCDGYANIITSISAIPSDRIFLHASEVQLYRYKSSGKPKRFSLGIRAPIPSDFLKVCDDLKIPIDRKYVDGGMFGEKGR